MFGFSNRTYRLFRIFGFDVVIDITWIIAFFMFAFIFRGNVYAVLGGEELHVLRSAPMLDWLLGFTIAIGLYASILAHEFAHALLARKFGATVRTIRLFLFGGAAMVENRGTSGTPKRRLIILLSGPITSLVIGAALLLLRGIIGVDAHSSILSISLYVVAAYLMFMNFTLGIFNLLPGFPLDGGQALMAGLELRGMPRVKAAYVPSRIGILLGVGLMAFGVVNLLLWGNILSAIFNIMIGWFLLESARAYYEQVKRGG